MSEDIQVFFWSNWIYPSENPGQIGYLFSENPGLIGYLFSENPGARDSVRFASSHLSSLDFGHGSHSFSMFCRFIHQSFTMWPVVVTTNPEISRGRKAHSRVAPRHIPGSQGILFIPLLGWQDSTKTIQNVWKPTTRSGLYVHLFKIVTP